MPRKSNQTGDTVLRGLVAIKRLMLDSGCPILDKLNDTFGGVDNRLASVSDSKAFVNTLICKVSF